MDRNACVRCVTSRGISLPDWTESYAELEQIARRQLFFVGGAPRSGTTWVQRMLNAHPDISCRGEAHFLQHLAEPLGTLMSRRRTFLEDKNANMFGEVGGYPLPTEDDFEVLLGTGVLLALLRQNDKKDCLAIGEKTPENVFFFPNLKRIFPNAKFIGIARDPRDSMTSAWHFFHRPHPDEDEAAAKLAFIRSALAPVTRGLRMMIEFRERFPGDTLVVTYEELSRAPGLVAAKLFRFLSVTDTPATVALCVEQTEFAAMNGGRPVGVEQNGSFFRKGVSGDWQNTLTEGMNELLLNELGWTFPVFGWHP